MICLVASTCDKSMSASNQYENWKPQFVYKPCKCYTNPVWLIMFKNVQIKIVICGKIITATKALSPLSGSRTNL